MTSAYTLGEILAWLLMTAVLGFVLGWLARELLLRRSRVSEADPTIAEEPGEEAVIPVEPGPYPGSAKPLPGGEAPTPQHVVKVSRGSKIYHAPNSPAYERTAAAMWFTSTEAAEAAGFRKPKNAQR